MDFTNRLKTITAGFEYPSGYEPYDCYNGLIARWMGGCYGLTKFSAPTNVTAVYCADSTRRSIVGEKDPVFGYVWSKSDEEYKFLV